MKPKTPYPNKTEQELFRAICILQNEREAAEFFRDLLTPAEITEFANRWQMVKLLVAGKSYLEIAKELETSTTTVTRVAHWLYSGTGGYAAIASRMFPKKHSGSPKKKPFKLRGKYTFLPDLHSME